MAHPLINYLPSQSLDIVADQLPAIARSLKDRGFSGLESYYGSHEQPVRELTARIAREAGLIPTGGSDFHGANKADVQLGVGRTGDLNVPYEILEELRAAR
jgi:predicted metal-dependent phosphoesterase TrpH